MHNKEQVFQQLWNDNRERLYRLCRGFVGDDSETDDLFQEVMLNVWRNMGQFRGTAKMSTWLYRIAINTALLYRKRSTRRSGVERPGLDRVPSRGYNPVAATDATTEQEQQLQQLRQAIQQLEKQDRIIITLVLENMSYQEISEVVGITVNYIGVKINRIKNKLSKKLKAYG